jgi:hypothetical protein
MVDEAPRRATVPQVSRRRLDGWQAATFALAIALAVAVTGWVLSEQRNLSSVRAHPTTSLSTGPLSSQVLGASRLLATDVGAYVIIRQPTVASPAAERRFVAQDQGHVSQIWNKYHIWNFWFSAAVARHYTQFDAASEIAYRYALNAWITDQGDELGTRYHCFDSVPFNGGPSKVLPCWTSELRTNSAQWAQDVSALATAWANVPAAQRANLPEVAGIT